MRPEGEIWLNIGCGVTLLSDFINVDKFLTLDDLTRAEGIYRSAVIEPGSEFVQADAGDLPFPDDYADYILSDCMIEHLPHAHILPTLSEWRRVLKPDGELVIITTDFNELASLWLSHITAQESHDEHLYSTLAQIIYGNQVGDGEFHHWPFTPEYMKLCLLRSGWPYFSIAVHPTNSPSFKVRGYKEPDHPRIVLTSMLYVSARKQVPPDAENNPEIVKVDLTEIWPKQ